MQVTRAPGARPCGRVGRGWEGVRGAAESARGRGREGDDTIYAVAKNIETSVKKKYNSKLTVKKKKKSSIV